MKIIFRAYSNSEFVGNVYLILYHRHLAKEMTLTSFGIQATHKSNTITDVLEHDTNLLVNQLEMIFIQ